MAPLPRRWPHRLLSSLVGTGAALLLAELVLRSLGLPDTSRWFLSTETFAADTFVADPECFWRLSPKDPDSNAQGLRGPWWESTKAGNELRILAVGDSCTYGFGVDWQDAWAVQLERLVQAAHPDRLVRSALAGLPGYSTFQDRRLLARVLPDAQPDLVVFYCGAWNDFVPAAGTSDDDLGAQLSASRLGVLLGGLFRPGLDGYRTAFELGETPQAHRVSPDAFAQHLEAMVTVCRQRGACVAMVAPTHPATTLQRFAGLGEYRERVLALAERLQVPCIDLAAVCRQLDPTGAPPLPGHATACFLDWVHPAPNLHAALARALAAQLFPGGAPPATASPPLLTADGQDLIVPGSGLARGPLHRVWLGDRNVPARFVGDDLCARVPHDLPPGEHVLQVVDGTGAHTLGRLVVPPLAMRAERTVRGDTTELVFRGEGLPGRMVLLWATYERAHEAVATPFGAFALPVPAVRQPVAGVQRFDLAVTDRHQTTVDTHGAWSVTVTVPATAGAPAAPRQVFAQALLVDPRTLRGALTEVCSIADGP